MTLHRTLTTLLAALLLTLTTLTPAQAAPTMTIDHDTRVFVGEVSIVAASLSEPVGLEAWTEVQLDDGRWARSQYGDLDQGLHVQIPLTYRVSIAGDTTWRVAIRTADGILRSEAFTLTRRAPALAIHASTAGTKVVGATTYVWGEVVGAPEGVTVHSEVRIGDIWYGSQTATTDADGKYAIPLTYGARTVGTTTWRVGVELPFGTAYSPEVTLTRTAPPVTVTASSAGEKPVGQTTNTWGIARNAPGAPVWTEVRIDGRWARSQTSTTSATGYFVIPLTYGWAAEGTTTWRVGVATDGGTEYSPSFTLTRTRALLPRTHALR